MTTSTPPSPATAGSTRPDSLTLLLFAILVLIGGTNFVAARITVLEMPPFWGAASRFAIAALVFWIIVLGRREKLPRGRALWDGIVAGAFAFGFYFGATYWSLSQIPSGLVSILAAMTPLATFLLAVAHGMEPYRRRALIGAVVAVVGFGVAFFQQSAGGIVWLPTLVMIVAVAFQAEGALIVKRLTTVSPIMANALGLSVGAVLLAVASLVAGERWSLPTRPETWIAYIYLIVLGSVVLFYLYLLLIRRWTASGTAYMFVLFPFVAVTLGALLAGESITIGLIAGGVLVLLGVWVGALSRAR